MRLPISRKEGLTNNRITNALVGLVGLTPLSTSETSAAPPALDQCIMIVPEQGTVRYVISQLLRAM